MDDPRNQPNDQPDAGGLPPPPPPRRPRRPPQTPPPTGRGRARQRRESGLYLPLWSILLVILMACAITAGVVFLVLNMGGDGRRVVYAQGTPLPPTQPPPVLIVSSPVPTERPADFPASPATATIPPEFDLQSLFQLPPDFSLAGPTLPTPVLTPTSIAITIGAEVVVFDLGGQELNVRDSPGVFGTNILFRATEGQRFIVVDGPQQQDNLTWWQIQSVGQRSQIGWASGQYLQAVPASQ